jgi:hypothetical protein
MSLRRRYYLAILPLFAGLALVNGLLVYTLEGNEIRWGLQQRAEGAAASIAGFWDIITLESGAAAAAKLELYSDRMGGLSIAWFTATGPTWQVRSLYESADIPLPPEPAASASELLQQQQLAWRFVESSAGADLIIGYAPVLDAAGRTLGVIGTAERDSSLREALAALRIRIAGLALALLLAGVMAIEVITRIAKRELGILTEAARDATENRYPTALAPGHIRELNDLGGTLLTMTSLLADESHQTRRRFFQGELLPNDSELAAVYRSHLEHPLPATLGSTSCALRRLGSVTGSDFFGWRETSNGVFLMVGRRCAVAGDQDLLARVVGAEAAREFLLGVAVQRPQGPSWPDALKVFPCEALQLIFIPASGATPTGWVLDATDGTPRKWTPRRRREVLGSLPAAALSIAEAYAGQFPDRSLSQVTDEVAGLLGPRFEGLLLICDFQLTKANGKSHERN